MLCLGGCGKAPMLTTLRNDFPCGGPAAARSAAIVGTEGEVMCFPGLGGGRCGEELARFEGLGRPLEGIRRPAGLVFNERCFGTGSEGRGPVGGATERRGSALPDMLAERRSCSEQLLCVKARISARAVLSVHPGCRCAMVFSLSIPFFLSFFSSQVSLRRTHGQRRRRSAASFPTVQSAERWGSSRTGTGWWCSAVQVVRPEAMQRARGSG